MKRLLIYLCIVFLLPFSQTALVFAENNTKNNSEKIRLELKLTDQGLKKFKSISNHALQRESSANTGDILQLVEDVLNHVQTVLAVFSILIPLIVSVAGVWFVYFIKDLKKELVNGQEKFDNQYKEIKELTAKAEEQFCSQTDEIGLLTSKADEKLKKTNARFKKLDKIDELTKTKISAIQKTLILCLENAPNRDIAFATYSKLLAAYEVLLNNSHEKITAKMQQEMEMKATLIQGNKKYVPEETVRFMIENMNLPYEVRGILWGAP